MINISRKILLTAAIAACILCLSGCGGKAEHEIITLGEDTAGTKTGMVTDTGGIEDHSFNQSAWEGLKFLNENIGARVSYIEATGTKEFESDLTRLAEDGNDVTWGIGYQFADAILSVAEKNPDKHFAIVDYAYEEVPENVTCAVFRGEEPSFVVGYIAAAMSETGKIGFVGGDEVDALKAFQYGYMAGAAYADREYGRTTEVESVYLGSFDNARLGKRTAKKMYNNGCDVIFHASGGSGVGVIEAAKELDKYVIGVDCDQSYLAPDNVLTSAVKKVDVAVSNISVQYGMGDNIGGRTLEYGLAEYAVGIPDEHPNIPAELFEAAKRVEKQIASHSILVPKTEEEYSAYIANN